MPGQAEISRGNLTLEGIFSINIAAGTVAPATAVTVAVAFTGAQPGDFLDIVPQTYLWPASQPAAQMVLGSAWCATPGTIVCSFSNLTAATITQTTPVIYTLNLARSANFTVSQTLPTALV